MDLSRIKRCYWVSYIAFCSKPSAELSLVIHFCLQLTRKQLERLLVTLA